MNRKLLVLIALLSTLTLVACESLNDLTPARADDEAIEAEIRARLTTEVPYAAFGISVRVDRGTVYLDGAVSSSEDRRKIVETVAGVEGVRKVVNNLGVRLA
ncbi:MAG TPA: BON domain-containing protein [Thermoanaerobaculia bacterium]|nr:BON domain-containing protein [Thermoanaerobaculia bacterium]